MSGIQATEDETTKFLKVLESISEQQAAICGQLDQLILLMNMPSESVIKVLERLLAPMSNNMASLNVLAQKVAGET